MKPSTTPTKKPRIAFRKMNIGQFKGTVQFLPIDDGAQMAITINFYGFEPGTLAESPEIIRMLEQGLTLKIEGVDSNEEDSQM